MGATEKLKTIHMTGSNKKLPMQIWDITGSDKFRTLSTIYFRDADAAILVFDVTSKESFSNLKATWLRDLTAIAPENMVKMVVGNKVDLIEGTKESELDKSGAVSEKT